MFQKTKQLCRKAFGFVNGIPTKVMMFSFMLLSGMVAKAQNSAGDYSAGYPLSPMRLPSMCLLW